MTKKIDRTLVFCCLRLLILFVIVFHSFDSLTNLRNYFYNDVKSLSKTGFFFIFPAAATGETITFDFVTFYACGLLNKDRIEKHLNIDVYDPFLFTQALERVVAPMKPQGTYYLQYPPIFFALITPLAYFDLSTAWRIWFFALVILVIITYVFTAYDSLKTRPLLLCGLFITLTAFPVTQNFFIGQNSLIDAAAIALSFRFLIDKKYFWAGFIAAVSMFKFQQTLIILIPGFCVGKKDFLRGFLLMAIIQALVSLLVVGASSMPSFIRINYMAEILNSFHDGNDSWYYVTFVGMVKCLPWFISNAHKIGVTAYILVFLMTLGLWLKVFPVLRAISNQAIQLTASISTTALLIFSLHGYWYDLALFIMPCLWLYIWCTSDDEKYTLKQSAIRLLICAIVLYLPFFFWDNLAAQLISENTIVWYQIRIFACEIVLFSCAIAALVLEFNKCRHQAPVSIS